MATGDVAAEEPKGGERKALITHCLKAASGEPNGTVLTLVEGSRTWDLATCAWVFSTAGVAGTEENFLSVAHQVKHLMVFKSH